jgi:hypothetical protein
MVLSCCIAGGVSAMTGPTSIAKDESIATTMVNRMNKGYRLPQSSVRSNFNNQSRPVTTTSTPRRPPVGCDPAFSPIVAPALAHIFNRCLT